MKLAIHRKYIPLLATFGVFVVILLVGGWRYPGFLSLRVFLNLFTDGAFLGLCAVGMTFVIISGGIDLSVGAVVALTSTLLASLTQLHGVPAIVAILLMLALGLVFGLGQGAIIHYFKAPPFIVTLAGMFLLRGLAFVTSLESIPVENPFLVELSTLSVSITEKASLTFSAGVLILAVALAAVGLGHTRFGRNVYAVGGSEQSVLLMGVPLARTKLAIYALSGFFSAAAGVMFTIYTSAGSASAAMGLEMDAIAAVVIGGTLLTGGFGYVAGSLVGTLIQGLIQTIIAFQGTLDVSWTKIFVGSLLLLFILLQRFFSQGGSKKLQSVRKGAPGSRPAGGGGGQAVAPPPVRLVERAGSAR